MNLTGKILTLLIFFLSVAFLTLAIMVGATHRNWKEQAELNKDKLSELRTALTTYKGKSEEINKQLNAERVARALALSQLESQRSTAVAERDSKEKQLLEEAKLSNQRFEALTNAEKRISEKDQQLAEAQAKNKQYVEDIAEQRQSVVNLTNRIYTLQGELSQLKTMSMAQAAELANRIKVMDAFGLTEDEFTKSIPPDVEGLVLRTDKDFIAISVGSDDGVREGHQFEIYRGDRYIGKAEVTRAKDNISAAKLIREFIQAPVAEGDYVTTKF